MKRYIVPILITAIVFLFILFYMVVFWFLPNDLLVLMAIKVAITGIGIFTIITLIKVLVQRIKEIKEDDEDDLSKY